MRRILAAWLVVCCLVLTQLGALAHEIGHLSDPQSASSHADDSKAASADKLCKLCGAFAQIGSGLRSGGAALPLATLAYHHWSCPGACLPAPQLLHAHCRGPPSVA